MQKLIGSSHKHSMSIALAVVVLAGLACNLQVSGSSTQTPKPGFQTPKPLSQTPKPELQTMPVNPDGQTYTDENGIGIMIPAGALSAGSAQLSSQSLPGNLAEELSQAYVIETPAYQVTTREAEDSLAPSTLSFPADSPEMRLLAIIDGEYAAVLNVAPANGRLSLPVDVHPSDVSGLQERGAMWAGGSIQYAVVTPQSTGQSDPRGAIKVAAPALQQAPYPCFSLTRRRCWQNLSGSVFVMMNEQVNLGPAESDALISQIGTVMDNYGTLGLDAAIISASNPLYIVVEPGQGSPSYRPVNGVVYIPNDVAKAVAGGARDIFLNHELAHLIQDEAYCLTCAYYSQELTWWIETAAENMVMLLDSAYVGLNLTTYGQIDVDDQTSAFQASPVQWPVDEFYVQAQLVKVNMCSDAAVCPLSTETFVKAINEGAFPYGEAAARQKISDNLEDYARYLLGAAPLRSNTAIPLEAVQSGEMYGDYVRITQTAKDTFSLEQRLGGGRMKPETRGGMAGLIIEASIQKDGVYVLQVQSGLEGTYAGLPAGLRIEAGTPLYYRSGNGEVQFHDGASELVIQPITSQANGIPSVRMVAVGKQGGEVFKAHLGLVDLSGVWMLKFPEFAGVPPQSLSCSDGAPLLNDSFAILYIGLQNETGRYVADTSADGLTWMEDASQRNALISLFSASGFLDSSELNLYQMTGMVAINPGEIKLQSNLIISERPLSSIDGTTGDQVVSVQGPGTYNLDSTFPSLEYMGGAGTFTFPTLESDVPLWRLSGGQAAITVNMTEVTYRFLDGKLESQNRNACQGTITSTLEVLIFKGLRP